MTYKTRSIIEDAASIAIVVLLVAAFAGFFGWIGYELGLQVGSSNAFLDAFNYIQDMQNQH